MKNIFKKIFLFITAVCMVITGTQNFAYAKEDPKVEYVKNLRENYKDAKEKEYINIENGRVEMYYIDCKIPKVDDPIDLDEYGYCKNGCKSVIEIYTAFFNKDGTLNFYEFKTQCLDCNKTTSKAILEEGAIVNKERFDKITKYVNNTILDTLKERRQNLISLGINNRNRTNEFIVYDENGIVKEDLLETNPNENLNIYGMCQDQMHKMVSYYTYEDNKLVYVSECFDCLKKDVKEVSNVENNMNILGSYKEEIMEKIEDKENFKEEIKPNNSKELEAILITGLVIIFVIIILAKKLTKK